MSFMSATPRTPSNLASSPKPLGELPLECVGCLAGCHKPFRGPTEEIQCMHRAVRTADADPRVVKLTFRKCRRYLMSKRTSINKTLVRAILSELVAIGI